ncbi:hypothetical protein CFP65_5482 [Kitasatospora sp. MMS16-BH015]|uniref:hypothetical protein n=1 Tax=Kitasatospora sp. MMS16-BH015 TaxID=2018025 RepID=UPI000CA0964F|nr:hypothetical protein [Kitasatospora sp. MMS16-BH015]AUG80183.1 hypothetical protein CFP65_5482 [Kitasatospora sp. MMS16-BH015]
MSARRTFAALAAAVTIGAALPVLVGAAPAWACGEATDPVAGASAPAKAPQQWHGDVQVSFRSGMPKQIPADGHPVQFTVELANHTGSAYDRTGPLLGFGEEQHSALRLQDLTLQAKTAEGWKTLALHHSCAGNVYADSDSLLQPLADGQTRQVTFRLALSAKAPADQRDISVYLNALNGGFVRGDLRITRPATATIPTATPTHSATPTATPPTPTTPAVQPAADVSHAASPAPAAPAAAPQQELASTGGGNSTGLLVGAGGALVVLGAGALALANRRRSAARR